MLQMAAIKIPKTPSGSWEIIYQGKIESFEIKSALNFSGNVLKKTKRDVPIKKKIIVAGIDIIAFIQTLLLASFTDLVTKYL